MEIIIEKLRDSITKKKGEIVERKGIGHPDTICDAICEEVSKDLSKYYIEKFGKVLHHNVDKALLIAGKSEPKFKSGRMIKPIKIIIAGRATSFYNGYKINVKEIAKKAAKKYLSRFHALKPSYYTIEIEIEETAGNLQEVFEIPNAANDTSFGVGYAPYSKTEQIVLKVANFLNDKETIKKYPWIGEDIKVMAKRFGDKITLICAIAFISKYIKNLNDYFEKKEKIRKEIEKISNCEVLINTLDKKKEDAKTIDDVYITVTGLSAEMGDDGQVGRGNRVNGVIAAERYMSLEAAAGKNPTNHVGKIYNVLANIIAWDLVNKKIVKECYVKILSKIGQPINKPEFIIIEVNKGNKKKIERIINYWLSSIDEVISGLINGKFRLF